VRIPVYLWLAIIHLFHYNYPCVCEVVCHLGFSLHFSNDSCCSTSFYGFIGYSQISFGESPTQIFCPFKNQIINFFIAEL
jgi:hypothetical protein